MRATVFGGRRRGWSESCPFVRYVLNVIEGEIGVLRSCEEPGFSRTGSFDLEEALMVDWALTTN